MKFGIHNSSRLDSPDPGTADARNRRRLFRGGGRRMHERRAGLDRGGRSR
jgi:hypothetical protein